MNTTDVRFRRNFIIASLLHIALIGGIIGWEGFFSEAGKPAMQAVELYTPADILGDLPKGEGHGRGAYAPPKEPAGAGDVAEPNNVSAPPAQTPAPAPRAAAAPRSDSNEIAIPKKPTPTKPVAAPRPTPTTANTATTTAKKPAANKTVKTGSSVAKGPATGSSQSYDQIRNRLAGALNAADGGTPYGDGQKAGGGPGKSDRIGSPDGAKDGVVGGIGQGSPYWQYGEHVHDKMYEAWEQPGDPASRDLVTIILLHIARDGTIADVELRNSSGNKLMDDSALAAAHKVRLLDPPPDALVRGSTADIPVKFRVEG